MVKNKHTGKLKQAAKVQPKIRGRKRNRKNQITSSRSLILIERRRKVIGLKAQGWDTYAIAQALKCSEATVHSDITECLSMAATELVLTSDSERELQKIRLEMLMKANLPLATEPHFEERTDVKTGKTFIIVAPPDPAYGALALKVMDRQAKLMALDVPEIKKLEVTGIREYKGVDLSKV